MDVVNEVFWWDGHVILSPVQISPSLRLRRERTLFPSDHEWEVAFSITSEFKFPTNQEISHEIVGRYRQVLGWCMK